jgi:predicted dehydrogenase
LPPSSSVVRIGVVGAGHWGPNLIRAFLTNPRSRVVAIAERDERRRAQLFERYDGIEVHAEGDELLARTDLDAVVIASPTATHHHFARAALARGLHVLVEKPLAPSVAEAEELAGLAAEARLVLLVGHVFLFHEGIRTVKRLIDTGELGRVQYIQSIRTNLGPIRTDVSALWDLAAHDVSIFHYWLGDAPTRATGKGGIYVNRGIEDVIFATLEYPNGVLASLHATWLSPRKLRQITVVGDRKMLVFDDMDLEQPIRLFDKGVLPADPDAAQADIVDSFAGFRSSIREGEILVPEVARSEPLRAECEHFLDCVLDGATCVSGPAESVAVVRALEAIERSLRTGSAEQEVG